jgi:hypothetical protein
LIISVNARKKAAPIPLAPLRSLRPLREKKPSKKPEIGGKSSVARKKDE